MADFTKMISALEAMNKKVDHAGFADRMTDPDFAEKVRQQLATKHKVQDSTDFYNTYNPAPTNPLTNENPNGPAHTGFDIRSSTLPDPKGTGSKVLDRQLLGAKNIGNYVKENPGKSTALLVSPFMPLTWPWVAGAIALSAGVEAIDKAHPFTTETSDYKTMTARENAVDIAASGLTGFIGHGVGTGTAKGIKAIIAPTLARDAEIAKVIAQNAKNEEILAHLGIRGGAGGAGEGMGAPSYIRRKISDLIRAEQPDIVNVYKELPRTTDDLAGLGDELAFGRVLREDAKTPINNLEIIQATNKNKAIEAMNRSKGTNKPLVEVPAPQYRTAEVEIPDYEIAKRYAELKKPKAVPNRVGVDLTSYAPNALKTALHNTPIVSGIAKRVLDSRALSNNVAVADALKTVHSHLGRTTNLGAGLVAQLFRHKIME